VYAFSRTTYNIVASSVNMITLIDGTPQWGFAYAGSYTYYTFTVNGVCAAIVHIRKRRGRR
jgi:hypothetical protein